MAHSKPHEECGGFLCGVGDVVGRIFGSEIVYASATHTPVPEAQVDDLGPDVGRRDDPGHMRPVIDAFASIVPPRKGTCARDLFLHQAPITYPPGQ